jgi:hypothetical protein
MRNRLHLGRRAAIFACAVSLAGPTTVLAAGPESAQTGRSCGSKVIMVPQKNDEPLRVPVSRIRVAGGATCAEANKVIRGALTKHLPNGWVLGRGNFKVPSGLTPQVAVNGHKKVMFAVVGG